MTNTIEKVYQNGTEYVIKDTTYSAGTGIDITGTTISNDGVTSVNGNTGAVTVDEGDVYGPASSTDGHLALFDGATGKLIKDGGAVPTGVPAVGSNGQVLTVVSGAAAWANASGGDIVVSSQANNTLTTGAGMWAGTEANYNNLTKDSNTLYFVY